MLTCQNNAKNKLLARHIGLTQATQREIRRMRGVFDQLVSTSRGYRLLIIKSSNKRAENTLLIPNSKILSRESLELLQLVELESNNSKALIHL